jgi:phage tail sheath protein FI
VSSSTDGDDGAPLTDYDVIGSQLERTGLFALDAADHFNFLCIPPLGRERDVGPGVLLVAARYCRERRALLLVDPPADWHTADEALKAMRQWCFASENAVMYFPRILAHDKLRGHFEAFAPCGAAAGMLARGDETHPVWGAAKFEEPILRPGYRPVCIVTEDKRARLAALGVNTLQAVRTAARIKIAARTLAAGTAAAADWQLLARRRLALFIVNSVERGTRWVVLTGPQGELAPLVEMRLKEFFEGLHAAGAFGQRPLEESFFVICDRRINPTDRAVPPTFRILIGFAAGRVGEFHSFRIAHSALGSQVTSVTLNRLAMPRASPVPFEWAEDRASQRVT